MAILNGTYYFNRKPEVSPFSESTSIDPGQIELILSEDITFISNGVTYNKITLSRCKQEMTFVIYPGIVYGENTNPYISIVYEEDGLTYYDFEWVDEGYRTVTFDNQIVSKELYDWITYNTTNIDKMLISYSTVKDIADTLRIATGTTGGISVGDFADKIASLHLITGKWVLPDSGIWPYVGPPDYSYADAYLRETVNFTSNGTAFTLLRSYYQDSTFLQMYYDDVAAKKVLYDEETYMYESVWTNEAYKTIDFGTTPQIVSEYFYNWLTTNATHISEG